MRWKRASTFTVTKPVDPQHLRATQTLCDYATRVRASSSVFARTSVSRRLKSRKPATEIGSLKRRGSALPGFHIQNAVLSVIDRLVAVASDYGREARGAQGRDQAR